MTTAPTYCPGSAVMAQSPRSISNSGESSSEDASIDLPRSTTVLPPWVCLWPVMPTISYLFRWKLDVGLLLPVRVISSG